MARYGATVDGVRALLPHLEPLTAATVPTVGQVQEHVDRMSEVVAARVGEALATVVDADQLVALTGLARAAVELGAAAWTEDARYPERAAMADTSYGQVLWSRYREVLEALLIALGVDVNAPGGPTGVPVYNFPPPSRYAGMGF